MSNPRDRIEARLGLTGPPLQKIRDAPPQIPDHELVRRIGQGAYGEVWLARNALGTWRAVKIVYRDNFRDERPYERELAGIRRFEPLSRSNEGFVDILQVGRDEAGGWFYYVMELADDAATCPHTCAAGSVPSHEGEGSSGGTATSPAPETYIPRTLARCLHHRGRLPLEDCLQLGLTLTLALGHLHRHGLIHRDIKPSNIIYVGGVPKLADIGLVTEALGANTFVGTEGFVPPEGPTSPQADLYALGKVLYEAAMGKDRNEFPEPFTQISTDHESVALMELNAVLLRACAPDPRKRYATAEEMHADLSLLHSGGSVKRRHQFDRQFQLARRVGAVAIAATLLIGGAWLWQHRQTQKMIRLAEEKSTLATEKTKLADDLTTLDAENRNRIVRLDIANGVRLWEAGDVAGALLWFADALPRVAHAPAEESIHRIRIQQLLHNVPRFSQVIPQDTALQSSAFSPDGERIVTGLDYGKVTAWNVRSGEPLWPPVVLESPYLISQIRFTHEGSRIALSSLRSFGFRHPDHEPGEVVAFLEAATGRRLWSLTSTNWLRAELSPDDRWWVFADTAHVIHVHDATDGRRLAELRGHTGRIVQFAMNAEGTVLASSGEDETVRLWRLPRGAPMGSAIHRENGPRPIALNQAGDLLAVATIGPAEASNAAVRTFEVATGEPVGAAMRFDKQSIAGMGFVGSGDRHLFVLTDQQCQIFDARTHEPVLKPVKHPQGTRTYSVSEDERFIAFGGPQGLAGVWSLVTGANVLPACLGDRTLADVSFSPDGKRLFAAASDGTGVVLPVEARPEIATHRFDAPISPGSPRPLQEWRRYTPDGRHYLLILSDGSVRQVDFERMTDERVSAAGLEGLRAYQATFDASGHRRAIFYLGGGRQVVELCTDEGGVTNRFLLLHTVELSDKMVFTQDGSRLLTPARDGRIRCWKTADGSLEWTASPNAVGQVALFPDGRTGFGVSQDTRKFALFDLVQGTERPASFNDTPMEIAAQSFSPAGDRFTLAGNIRWSRIYDARNTEPLTPFLRHDGQVWFVDWSPDGRRITTAGDTPEVRVWDAITGELVLPPLRLGNSAVETGLWSADGRFIVARNDDNVVRVWDAATGEPVTPILRHDGFVRFARMVANGRLITMSLPDVMRAWDLVETRLPADVIADYAKLASGRRLNAAGAMVALKPDEITELNRSLHARAPELFQ